MILTEIKEGEIVKLLLKQRVFSWTDTYDVYDEKGEAKYFIKAEFFSLGHKIHVYDRYQEEIGMIQQKLFTFMPKFEVIIRNRLIGRIEKQVTFFRPKYKIDYNNWRVEGNFWGWDYDVVSASGTVVHISKELLHWGDTYVIDIQNPSDEISALLLVLAIDAANCSHN